VLGMLVIIRFIAITIPITIIVIAATRLRFYVW
jgi:hypothetical protein